MPKRRKADECEEEEEEAEEEEEEAGIPQEEAEIPLEEAEVPRKARRSKQEEAEIPRERKRSNRPGQGGSSALEEAEAPRKARRSRRPAEEGDVGEQEDAVELPIKRVGRRQREGEAVAPDDIDGAKKRKKKKKSDDVEPDASKTKKKVGKKQKDQPVLRVWRDPGIEGKKNKNKVFTPEENEKAWQGLQLFLAARGLTEEEALQSLRDERQRDRKTWGHVASLADLPNRSVASIVRRVRRLLYGSLGRWTPEQVEALKEEVLVYCTAGDRIGWKDIGLRLGVSEERAKDKWKLMCTETGTRRKFGKWNALETWTLRQAVVELKNHLAPTHDIPWKQVRRWIPHRSSEQCRQQWFLHVLPQLLHFQDKHGQPIDDAVLERSLLRALKKSHARMEYDVNWRLVNTWWPARMNRQRWRAMQRRLPLEIYGSSFPRRVRWLYDAMHCKQEKRMDHRLLKHAVTVIEAQAAEESGGDEEGEEEED